MKRINTHTTQKNGNNNISSNNNNINNNNNISNNNNILITNRGMNQRQEFSHIF